MGKDSQGKKGLAIIIAVVVVVVVIVILLLKGCGAKEFTVSFDTNGGSSVNSIVVEKDGTIKKPSAPTREGYEFAGWYLDDKEFDFSSKITKDVTLKAKWVKADNDMSLDVTSLSLVVGKSKKVNVTLSGELEGSELTWKSSDTSIATVDKDGNIKALKKGSVTITVSTKDGKHSKTISVTVTDEEEKEVNVTGVSISGSKSVEVGKTVKLTANVKPTNATNKKVTWKSSDTSIATVSTNGTVKGVKPGKVTITVTTADGSKTSTIEVTVTEAKKDDTPSQNTPSTPDDNPTIAEKQTYNVTFNSDGGSSVSSQKVDEGDRASKPADPTRTGYKFEGWQLDGKDYDFNSQVRGNITLVAKWTPIYTYEVKEIPNGIGGTEMIVKVFVYYGDTDITRNVTAIATGDNANSVVGDYSSSAGAIVTNTNNKNNIKYIYYNGGYIAVTKR